jgi:hypothetical protein
LFQKTCRKAGFSFITPVGFESDDISNEFYTIEYPGKSMIDQEGEGHGLKKVGTIHLPAGT